MQTFRGTVTASVPGESNQDVAPTAKVRFPRTARLLRHADFERVYKQGRRQFSASMTVFYWRRPATETAGSRPVAPGFRVGFTVGRALGGAVQRNRMKRRLREAVRLTKPSQSTNADVVINPKKVLLTIDFESVLNEVRQAFVVIEQKLAPSKASPKGAERESAGRKSWVGSEEGTSPVGTSPTRLQPEEHDQYLPTRNAPLASALQMGDLPLVSAGMPLRSYVFGICDGSRRAFRCIPRQPNGFGAASPLSSLCEGWIRSGGSQSANGDRSISNDPRRTRMPPRNLRNS